MTRTAGALAALAGAVAAIIVALVVAPFGPTTIDPDASASALYFERLVAGRRLEAFVPTTPKPLLTFVDGVAWSVTHDWRVLTWIAIVVFGAAVALTAMFVWRASVGSASQDGAGQDGGGQDGPGQDASASAASGAFAAAVFMAVAMASWSDLALEVSRANSLVPAIACWAGAGVALVGPRRRPWAAGVALFLGSLVRFETLAIVGGILASAAIVAVGEALFARRVIAPPWLLGPRRVTAPRRLISPRTRWSRRDVATVAALGLLAVPVACLHDALLTGDPFYWIGVPARYTAVYAPTLVPMPLSAYLGTLAGRVAAQWPLVALAAAGGVALAARRSLVALVGLGSLAVGMVVLLSGLAVRGVYISNRYYEPLDLALLGLAAFGVGGLVDLAAGVLLDLARPRRRLSSVGLVGATLGLGAAIAFSVVAAAVVMGRPAPWDPAVESTLAPVRVASVNLEANLGRLAVVVSATVPPRSAAGAVGAPLADPRSIRLYVPSTLRARVVLATGAPLTTVGDTLAAYVGRPSWDGLRSGQWLYHDPAVDRPIALTRALDADPPDLAGATARTLWRDASTGVRLLRIDVAH